MTRVSVFNSPFLLGFDQLEELMDSVSKNASEGYPPYNIEHISENIIRISLAVAGFSEQDLEITIENNQMLIRGKRQSEPDRAYLHRGIASRQFMRKFVLADGMDVDDAYLENGLLHINLLRPEPETSIRTIKIRS